MFFFFYNLPFDPASSELKRFEEAISLFALKNRTLTVATLLLFVAIVRRQALFGDQVEVSMKELADDLGLHLSSMSRQLDALEKRGDASEEGLIERRLMNDDRRQRGIILTSAGIALAAEISRALGIERLGEEAAASPTSGTSDT